MKTVRKSYLCGDIPFCDVVLALSCCQWPFVAIEELKAFTPWSKILRQRAQVLFPFACQRSRDQRGTYRPPDEVIRPRDYEIARYGLFLRYALFPEDELVGVAVFSMPMSHKVLTNIFPCDVRESVELGRFVLLDSIPANAESFFFARCRELLQQERIKGIIAFSDDTPRTDASGIITFKGHIGTIYQSSNASYYLRSPPRKLNVLPDGSIFNARSASKIRNLERGCRYAANILVRHGATQPPAATPDDTQLIRIWLDHWSNLLTRPLYHSGNHRYAWSLHASIKLPHSAPYPKWPTQLEHPMIEAQLSETSIMQIGIWKLGRN